MISFAAPGFRRCALYADRHHPAKVARKGMQKRFAQQLAVGSVTQVVT